MEPVRALIVIFVALIQFKVACAFFHAHWLSLCVFKVHYSFHSIWMLDILNHNLLVLHVLCVASIETRTALCW